MRESFAKRCKKKAARRPHQNGHSMLPKRAIRSETEITESEGTVSYRRIAFWSIVGIAIVVGIVLYFKYARLLPPLLG
jgi:hypothetical protein